MSKLLITRYYLSCEQDFKSDPIIDIKDINGLVLARVSATFYASAALEGSCKLSSGSVLNVCGEYIGCPTIMSKALIDVSNKSYRGKKNLVGLNKDGTKYLAFKRLPSSAPWGIGARNNPLQPFVSCAADPKLYPFGTKLYVKELDGLLLPNNTKSDGKLIVADVGGSIKGNHIDLFCGSRGWSNRLNLPDNCEVEIIK